MGLVRTIIGIIGNVISFGLFIAPSHVYELCKDEEIDDFFSEYWFPYSFGLKPAMRDHMLWILYGLPMVRPDSLLFVTMATLCSVVAVIYVPIVFWYTTKSNMKEVVQTKSVEDFLLGRCLVEFVIDVVWFVYANLKTFDLYIAIATGIGGLFGFIQLVVFAYYYRYYGTSRVQDDAIDGDAELHNIRDAPV